MVVYDEKGSKSVIMPNIKANTTFSSISSGISEILYDYTLMQSAISACKTADDEIHRAKELIQEVRSHSEWKCIERETIAEEMNKLKKAFENAVIEHENFYNAVLKVGEIMHSKEVDVKGRFDSVDDIIARILAVPVPDVIRKGTGIVNWFKNKFISGGGISGNSGTIIPQTPKELVDKGIAVISDPITVCNFKDINLNSSN